MRALGFRADAAGVAAYYGNLVDLLMIDRQDESLRDAIATAGPTAVCGDILVPDPAAKLRFAREIVSLPRKSAGQAA